MRPTFLVTGATGLQGGATARELLAQNVTVHAFVRNLSKPAKTLEKLGAILFVGDYDNVPAIKAAIAGCTGVFLNPYPVFSDPYLQFRQAQNFITAAKAAHVKSMVVSTVIVANMHPQFLAQDQNYTLADYYGPKHAIEEAVRVAGFESYTILRPSFLVQNYLAPECEGHWPEFRKEKLISVYYLPGTRISYLDAYDVGKFGAVALLNPEKFDGQEIDLGSNSLTLEEVAQRIGAVAGLEIKTRYMTPEETSELDEGKSLRVRFQMFLKERPSVYEVDGEKLERYGIPLTPFDEVFERREEREALLTTLGVEG